uniref:ubiquitin carboxyl-terminal hydrolase 37-like n=1 Tax=Myxine glutinosa TaxID=7769 RepID=UPI00358E315F
MPQVPRNVGRLTLTFKNSVVAVQQASLKEAQHFKQLLDGFQKRPKGLKPSQGSYNLSNVITGKQSPRRIDKQFSDTENLSPNKHPSMDGQSDALKRGLNTSSPLGTPSRCAWQSGQTSRGLRMGLSTSTIRSPVGKNRIEKRKRALTPVDELNGDYAKENDLRCPNYKSSTPRSSGEQARKMQEDVKVAGMPLHNSTACYWRGTPTRDYSLPNRFLNRSNSMGPSPAAKRSLGFLTPPTASSLKRQRPLSSDYAGWNKSKVLLSQQSQLQGFSNLGNTCYMNAILQSLFALQPFSHDLLKQRIPWKRVPQNTLLRRITQLLSKKDTCPLEIKRDLLKRVKIAISSSAERFSGFTQNDAHEFLSQCLDQLKEDMEKLNKNWRFGPPIDATREEGSPCCLEQEDPNKAGVFTCPIASNMEFEVLHTITCRMCGQVVLKQEQFNDLSIELPRKNPDASRSIQDSLDLFFRVEQIEYTCEKCECRTATVIHKFFRLPRILILHLKRYSFDVNLALNNKVGQQLIIPKFLTLQAHCVDGTRSPPAAIPTLISSGVTKPLQSSQAINGSSGTPGQRRFSFKPRVIPVPFSSTESDTEDEQMKHAMNLSKQSHEREHNEQQREEQAVLKTSVKSQQRNRDDGITEEKLLAMAFEISQHDAVEAASNEVLELSFGQSKETQERSREAIAQQVNSSSETGFCEDEEDFNIVEAHEVSAKPNQHTDSLSSTLSGTLDAENWTLESGGLHDSFKRDRKGEARERDIYGHEGGETKGGSTDSEQAVDLPGQGEEDKENRTPSVPVAGGVDGAVCELDWIDKSRMTKEQEERELQEALEQSLREQVAMEQKEEDELKRATELSLQEYQNKLVDLPLSDDDSGNEGSLDLDRSEAEVMELKSNAETGELPYSYQLVSIVSHIGSESSAGHYITDALDVKKRAWFTYDDTNVITISESAVRATRERNGYIFFYMHKEILEQLQEVPP